MMVRVIQRQWVVLEEREGGLPPGSPEAVAAIERVRKLLNPDTVPASTPPAWSIKEPDSPEFRECARCGAAVRGKPMCKPCTAEVRDEQIRTRSITQKTRICEVAGCGADITGYAPRSLRCASCRLAQRKEQAKEKYYRRKASMIVSDVVLSHPCARCGGAIQGRHRNARYCEPCRLELVEETERLSVARALERRQKRRAERLERLTAELAEGAVLRPCCDCGTDISHKIAQARRCEACMKKAKNRHRNELKRKQREAQRGQVSA